MATRQELLALLQNMLRNEEEAIPIYARHLNNALFLSEFSAADQQDIKSKLQILIVESQQHQRNFENMIRSIEGGQCDVY
ncbi:MAG: hypothetical protein JW832_04035 [Deltaproteobacteria bacterium]|nr:hypothetical protein [Deltaproteobacteria bacterium]